MICFKHCSMRYRAFICCIILLFAATRAVYAQRFALGGGYQYTHAESLNNAVRFYNFTRHTVDQFPSFHHGVYATLDFGYQILPFLFVGPRASARYMSYASTNLVFSTRSVFQAYELMANVDFYPFSVRGYGQYGRGGFTRSFYVSAFVGASYINTFLLRDGERLNFREGPFNAEVFTPLMGLGIGFDIFTDEFFSLTPEIRAGYHLPIDLDGLSFVYSGGNLLEAQDKSSVIFLHAGLQLRFYTGSTARR